MITGKGTLALRSGRKIELGYLFASDFGDTRAGYLLCDVTKIDPAEFCHRLVLTCEDGSEVVLAVMHSSDRYLAITGRVLRAEAAMG